jgi:hypothetical protein
MTTYFMENIVIGTGTARTLWPPWVTHTMPFVVDTLLVTLMYNSFPPHKKPTK